MTSQKDQIQVLISDIDGVLQKTTPRLPWVMSGEVTQQRQTLERVRNYLVSLQRRMAVQDGYQQVGNRPDLLAHDIYYQQPNHPAVTDVSLDGEPEEVTAQQMLQTVIQEMGHLRANLMQPLQTDLEAMRKQRESLQEEIRQLEAQRGALSPQGNQQQAVNEFLQALMGRLQETLPQQVAQALQSASQPALPAGDRSALTESASLPAIYAATGGGIAPSNTDQLIIKLDSTLKVIFESLERSVQAYQESLSQGLDRMHGLGQQGEMMFTALVNHLAQQLGREASSYLQSSGQFVQVGGTGNPATTPTGEPSSRSVTESSAEAAVTQSPTQAATGAVPTSGKIEDSRSGLKLPYPGAELPPPATDSEVASVEVPEDEPTTSVDAAIDAWLKSASAATGITVEDQDLESLDLPGLSLGELDLNQIDTEDLDSILETESGIDTDYLADDNPIANLAYPDPSTVPEEDTEDIDAYLKRLEEQLGSEFQDELSVTSLEEAEAEIDRILSGAELTDAGSFGGQPQATGGEPGDERDEFYESLFGSEAEVYPEAEALADDPEAAAAADTGAIAELAATQAEAATEDPILGWDLSPSGASPFADASDVLEADNFGVDADVTLDEATADDFAATEEQSVPTISDLLLESPSMAQPEFAPEPEAAIATPEPAIEDEISSLTDLFEGVDLPEAIPVTEPTLLSEPATPTITDQFPAVSLPGVPPVSLVDGDDQYTPASPEESLLPAEDQFAQLDTSLLIDETTLNSLSEDLFSLEGLAGQPTQPNITQPTIADNDLTLGDWGDAVGQSPELGESSLQDLADTLPAAPQPVADRFPAPTEPTTDVFTLEGMDDLFSDLPPTPSVTPVPPPGSEAGNESPFTLDAMGDLFADMSPAPSVQPITPPASPASTSEDTRTQQETTFAAETPPFSTDATSQEIPFTLEGMDDLFADVPSLVTPSPAIAPPVEAANPVPFTLEGMDDLFDDVPPVEAAAPIAASDNPSQADALTFAEMEDLFADVPPAESTSAAVVEPTTVADQRTSFTLERLGDVFTEVPTTAMVEPTPAEAIAPATEPFTLEQMGDVLMEVPAGSAPSPVTADNAAGFTLERVGDLFIETPAASESQSDAAIASEPSSPFTLEQVGDLFMEVPATEGAAPESFAQSPQGQDADFTLEQVGDLFMEVPSATSPTDSLDFQTLDQAFESLLGQSESSTPSPEPLETPSQAPEKKKKAN